MKKESIGICVCILLVTIAFAPGINADVSNIKCTSGNENNKSTILKNPTSKPLDFGKWWADGGSKLLIIIECHEYNADTLDISFDETSGQIFFIFGGLVSRRDSIAYEDVDILTYKYWIGGLNAEFEFSFDFFEANGVAKHHTLGGQVHGMKITDLCFDGYSP